MFKDDTNTWTEEEFDILDGLFGHVDAFCCDPDLRGENDIDEDQLKTEARMALERLCRLTS